MKRTLAATLILALGLLLVPLGASASTIKTFVKEFTGSSPGADEMRQTLRTLLVTRLSGDGIEPVASEQEADVVVTGSYTVLGKVFSLDAVAKTAAGKEVATAFEEGEVPNAVIPAVGKIATKLKREIAKGYVQKAPAPGAAAAPAPVAAPAAATTAGAGTTPAGAASAAMGAPAAAAGAAPVTMSAPAAAAAPAKISPAPATTAAATAPAPAPADAAAAAKAQPQPKPAIWSSQRISGAQSAMAYCGSNLLVTVRGDVLRLFRKDAILTEVAETEVPSRQKILSLDAAPGGPQGGTLLFVSIIEGDAASSRVYQIEPKGFKLVKEKVPYLFRSVTGNGGSRLYAQQLSGNLDYFGDVYEASLAQGELILKNPIKMPRFANIFNFNTFRDRTGKSYITAFSDGGYLIVYSDKGEELWRSDERMGGSESFFLRPDKDNERFFGSSTQPRFLDQRIAITDRGEIVVPQNTGTMVFGNTRSYSRYTIVALSWNGTTMDELWRTPQSQGYLADYFLEPATREIILLDVIQKEGPFGKGASAIRITTLP